MEHLHDRGLLYCDVSADNVIHSTIGVKLIDLGAVRRMDDLDGPVSVSYTHLTLPTTPYV